MLAFGPNTAERWEVDQRGAEVGADVAASAGQLCRRASAAPPNFDRPQEPGAMEPGGVDDDVGVVAGRRRWLQRSVLVTSATLRRASTTHQPLSTTMRLMASGCALRQVAPHELVAGRDPRPGPVGIDYQVGVAGVAGGPVLQGEAVPPGVAGQVVEQPARCVVEGCVRPGFACRHADERRKLISCPAISARWVRRGNRSTRCR